MDKGKHRINHEWHEDDDGEIYMVPPQRETDDDPHISEGLLVTGVIVLGLLVCAGLAALSMMYVGLI